MQKYSNFSRRLASKNAPATGARPAQSAGNKPFNAHSSAPAGRSYGSSFSGGTPRAGGKSYGNNSSGGGRNRYGGSRFGQSKGSGFSSFKRGPMQKSGRMGGQTMNINLLINKVNDTAVAKPMAEDVITHQFADFAVDARIKNNIRAKGYVTPTPIQDKAIPAGLEGKDVIGIANTGTGKTAAFLIPLLNKMLANRLQKVLILAPTRELALQISDELREFGKGFGLASILCIGGSNIMHQIRMLKHPHNFIIGTPGRILDLIDRKLIKLEHFHNVVLDEADRMVDMGFINDIRTILAKLPKERQSFFFTATLEPKVEELIRQFMINPVKISVKMRDTASNVEQDIVRVPQDSVGKLRVLIEHLGKPGFDKVLVFGRTKHGVEKVAKALFIAGIKSDSIHGNKSQNYRQKALMKFKKGEIKALVATDVAARGLDISMVSHVINFDVPATYEDYVHRIGRTGRADKKGIALTFVTQ